MSFGSNALLICLNSTSTSCSNTSRGGLAPTSSEGGLFFLSGTGNLLTTVNLTPNLGNCPGYSAGFCPFGAAGVNFAGTAKSVSFGGVANQIVFDDITFGSATPSDPGNRVPEPASLALVALGLLAAGASRQRHRQA